MKPYKCPCCDGWGKREIPLTGLGTSATPEKTDCPSCKGRGVIWPEEILNYTIKLDVDPDSSAWEFVGLQKQ